MVEIKIDTSKFDKALQEYMKYSSRSFVDAVNTHAYFIARNACSTTHAAEASKIKSDLEAMSKSYPNAPLAAILINRDLKKKGKKGLYGEKMKNAIEKFIRIRQSHRNFLRAGWLPAVKLLASFVPNKKGGSKIPANTDKNGRDFGGAIPAQKSSLFSNPIAKIWNTTAGDPKSIGYVEEGLQKAMDMEVESMKGYIYRKQEEASKKFFG